MTIELFMFLFTAGSMAASLLTQAMKKAFLSMPSNVIALGSSLIVGLGGTICSFILLEIPFVAKNIVCIILMPLCIWVSSMVSYDKVMQTIAQYKRG